MGRLKRLALYGGTFDPVHLGHTTVAETLLKVFRLDGVIFVPAHLAPHKRAVRVTPAVQRYAMLALATQENDCQYVSTAEIDQPERPFTVETLRRFATELGAAARLFFVMGADSWSEITTWKEWERVLSLTDHIIVTRPGYEPGMDHVTPSILAKIVDLRGLGPDEIRRELDEGPTGRIYITDAVRVEISATEIRHAIRENAGSGWMKLVPPPVADYIEKYGLYRERHESEFFNEGKGPRSGIDGEIACGAGSREG